MAAGAAVTGIPPTATAGEADTQLRDAGAALLVRDAGRPADATSVPRTTAGGADGLALLPYSSGTTGLPKGVMLTHGNLVAAARQVGAGVGYGAGDTVLAIVPFAHVMGFVVTLLAPLAAGATVVTMPRFDLAGMLELVERHRVTVLAVPPPVMAALASHPLAGRDLSSVELVVSGGAPLGAALQEAVARRLPRAAVGQGYGLTETAVGITMPDRRAGTVPGSVGPADAEHASCGSSTRRPAATSACGGRGELWARGPQVMAGYLGRPDATAAVLDPAGWLRTGDLGSVDADGNVFVHDRIKELIKVNAHQVAPAELEALLLTHPDVADAAVVGRPDARCGEVPVAWWSRAARSTRAP